MALYLNATCGVSPSATRIRGGFTFDDDGSISVCCECREKPAQLCEYMCTSCRRPLCNNVCRREHKCQVSIAERDYRLDLPPYTDDAIAAAIALDQFGKAAGSQRYTKIPGGGMPARPWTYTVNTTPECVTFRVCHLGQAETLPRDNYLDFITKEDLDIIRTHPTYTQRADGYADHANHLLSDAECEALNTADPVHIAMVFQMPQLALTTKPLLTRLQELYEMSPGNDKLYAAYQYVKLLTNDELPYVRAFLHMRQNSKEEQGPGV